MPFRNLPSLCHWCIVAAVSTTRKKAHAKVKKRFGKAPHIAMKSLFSTCMSIPYYSLCSTLEPADILREARGCCHYGIAYTADRNTDAPRGIPEGILENGVCLLVAIEYHAPEGDFLLFGPFDDLRPGMSAACWADWQGNAKRQCRSENSGWSWNGLWKRIAFGSESWFKNE